MLMVNEVFFMLRGVDCVVSGCNSGGDESRVLESNRFGG